MKGIFLVKLVTVAVALYELAHPLSGKPIDIWDILATVITDMISYFLFRYIFISSGLNLDYEDFFSDCLAGINLQRGKRT